MQLADDLKPKNQLIQMNCIMNTILHSNTNKISVLPPVNKGLVPNVVQNQSNLVIR